MHHHARNRLCLLPISQHGSTGSAGTPEPGPYRVQVGDRIAVQFFKTDELDQELTVGPDGAISLLLVGVVECNGHTVTELTEEITLRYERELREPQLTVSVAEYSSMAVYVSGEVYEPGLLPYRGGQTVLEAITEAGGFRETARLTDVVIVRKGRDGQALGTVVDVKSMLRDAEFGENVTLLPSDVIFVPRSRIADANLWVDQYIRKLLPLNVSYFLGFRR